MSRSHRSRASLDSCATRRSRLDRRRSGFCCCAPPHEGLHLLRESSDSEQVSVTLDSGSGDERRFNRAVEHGLVACHSSGEPRRIDHDVDFLRALDLVDLGDGTSAAGGGFPMNVVLSVACLIFAQTAQTRVRGQAGEERACRFWLRRGARNAASSRKIGIRANLRGYEISASHGPQSERRWPFEKALLDAMSASALGCTLPGKLHRWRLRGKRDGSFLGSGSHSVGRYESQTKVARFCVRVVNQNGQDYFASFDRANDDGEFDAESGECPISA